MEGKLQENINTEDAFIGMFMGTPNASNWSKAVHIMALGWSCDFPKVCEVILNYIGKIDRVKSTQPHNKALIVGVI